MKKVIFLFAVTLLFFACTDNSSRANNEKQYPLQLNENCDTFVKDTSLMDAIQNVNLTDLKKSLEDCASLDISLYDSIIDQEYVIGSLIWEPDADSMIYYLIDNGMDSAAKNMYNEFATEAMWAGDTTLVRYAINKGYPITGATVYRAIEKGTKGGFGSKIARDWYYELLPMISDIDSVRECVSGCMSILHMFCSQMNPTLVFIPEEDQLFYFQDLIDRGYSINQKTGGGEVELDACRFGRTTQTDLQKKFTDILIKAGADTTLVRWRYLYSE